MKVIHVTDLHGDLEVYEAVFHMAVKKEAKAILIGGDITPGFNMAGQRAFLENYFVPRVGEIWKKYMVKVFVIMGNDDFGFNVDILEKADGQGIITLLHNRVERLGDYWVAGYPYINSTPFLFKEWERGEEHIEKDLDRLAKKSDPKNTVYLFHAPPKNTNLDMLYTGEHVGSTAIRNFIEKYQPYMTLHGHIHESPMMSGLIGDRIGDTISVNPGNCNPVLIKLGTRKVNVIQ